MIRTLVVLCMAMTCSAAAAAAARPLRAGGPFLGKWTITCTPSGEDANQPGVREFKDTLTFTPTEFSSKFLADHGFKPADYDEDTRAFGPGKFSSTQKSDNEGRAKWQGVVDANEITGTLEWTRKDGTVTHYDISGNREGT